MQIYREVVEFLSRLWSTIGAALSGEPDLLRRVTAYSNGDALVAALLVLAGGSLLLGQSVTLFANRVRPDRFVFSLAFYGALFALGQALWAASIWLCTVVLFGSSQPLTTAVRIVGLSSAPLLFGFLIALVYLGTLIEWALRIWSLLIMLTLVQATFGYTIWQALACVALGWLLIQVGTRLLGQPLATARDWLWRIATGTDFDTSEEEVAMATQELRAHLAERE